MLIYCSSPQAKGDNVFACDCVRLHVCLSVALTKYLVNQDVYCPVCVWLIICLIGLKHSLAVSVLLKYLKRFVRFVASVCDLHDSDLKCVRERLTCSKILMHCQLDSSQLVTGSTLGVSLTHSHMLLFPALISRPGRVTLTSHSIRSSLAFAPSVFLFSFLSSICAF